ncbi:MAG: hypothetical protein IKR49_07830 [Clostridia bacterium]|nr:hypothetical protein [Clostridia bacterium]
MKTLSLSGDWTLRRDDGATFLAVLPGTDFGALMAAGEIRNPLTSGVEEEALATSAHDYTFLRSFSLDADALRYAHVHFRCDVIDTLCTCVINGKTAFESKSAFVPVDVEVKPLLRVGENSIELRFRSPSEYIIRRYKEEPLMSNPNGVNGICHIRKPGCHFGWDWGPCVPYSGALTDVTLQCFDRRIEDISIRQETTKKHATVRVTAKNADRIRLLTPEGMELEGENGVFFVEHPSLWYTYEMNGLDVQPLYTVVFENEDERIEKKIGLRSLVLDRSEDEFGEQFRFLLNGEPIFCKGANLIPFSALFEDSDNETIDRYLQLARRANFNMLRVWGGGEYASEHLLSRCDEMGILIWQDFCFACQLYPFYDESFTDLVMEEVRAQVTRMGLHPSLALWCGNNEAEMTYSFLPKTHKLIKAYLSFFYGTLRDYLAQNAAMPYIPSSPCGSEPFKGTADDSTGDTHLWSVWHGLKKLNFYATRDTRFLSEFGLESLPSMEAIRTFAQPEDYSLASKPFMHHQKCVGGNRKMLFYLTELFDYPGRFQDLPALTGLVQDECIKNAASHFRRQKGRSNGCLVWQFNDVWNCPSWSMVDFTGMPKAAQYHARDYFAPVGVTVHHQKSSVILEAHNDTLSTQTFDVSVRIFTVDGACQSEEMIPVTLEQNSQKTICTIPVTRKTVLEIRWRDHIMTELCCAPRNLHLPPAGLQVDQDGDTVTIRSDAFAYGVHIEADAVPLDNDFSIMPGESRTVRFETAPTVLHVTCVNNMPFSRRPLKRLAFRTKYRLEPRNITREIYYGIK